jgi:hypothetical protein
MRRFRKAVSRKPVQRNPQPRAALFALLCCAGLLLFSSPASAATAVSGATDPNAPLEIDPSTAPNNPRTITRDLAGSPVVGFIQRMPVTKRVTEVTIGDLGRDESGCGETMVRLFVRQHTTGDLQSGGDMESFTGLVYSAAYQPLPSTPGKVTWTIPAATFRKGRGYSFYLTRQGTCRYARQTTWDHDSAKVNGGPAACTGGPRPEPKGTPVQRRMWHERGQNDWSCTSSIFDPEMPTGWLMIQSGTGGGHVRGGTRFTYWPTPTDLCGAAAANAGATVEHWRPSPNPPGPGYNDYVCMWPQYGPLRDTTSLEDGWYYGIPWANDGSGAPRDAYVKLHAIDYEPFLQQHAPILKYDSGETFHALSPGALTDFYVDNHTFEDTNSLKDGEGPFAVAYPYYVGPPPLYAGLGLSYLGSTYPVDPWPDSRRAGTAAQAADSDDPDFVSARGNNPTDYYEGDSRAMEERDGYAEKVFGRTTFGDDGKLWLQYWLFYYHSAAEPPSNPTLGPHEGDWEMVQIQVSDDGTPEKATYAQHDRGQTCDWPSVEASGDQPVVYVARQSHASYFQRTEFDVETGDRADGLGGGLFFPEVVPIGTDTPSWVAWPGKWGDSDTSPPGPEFQQPARKWDNPSDWADDFGC